jgi:hypothetical protein
MGMSLIGHTPAFGRFMGYADNISHSVMIVIVAILTIMQLAGLVFAASRISCAKNQS